MGGGATIDPDTVAITRIMDPDSEESIENSVRRVLDLIDASSDLRGKKTAMIKPNICCEKDWTTGATTCPWVIRSVVHWLKGNGIHDITVADSSIVGQDTMENMERLGLRGLAEELGLKLVDLDRDDRIELRVHSPRVFELISVARTPLEADYLINIPVMKTHICTSVTLSMKNLKGLLGDRWKKQFHFMGLDGALADLASVVRPDLNIIDGTVGMEGRGPMSGTPKGAAVLVASRDHFAADIAASRLMGLEPSEIRHLAMYAEGMEMEVSAYEPQLVGDIDFGLAFRKPVSAQDQSFQGIELEWGDPCSGCANALGAALDHLERDGDLSEVERRGGALIALGKKAEPEANDNLFLMGRCQHRNRRKGVYIPGCPPQSFVIRGLFYEMIGKDTEYRRDDVLREAEEAYGDEHEED